MKLSHSTSLFSRRPLLAHAWPAFGALAVSVSLLVANPVPVAAQNLNIPAASKSYTLQEAFPGLTFDQPVCITSVPGEKNRLFVVEKNGQIQVVTGLDTDKPAKSLFIDLTDRPDGRLATNSECGALGLAFPADFAKSKRFYVYYSLTINGQLHQRVSRFELSATDLNKGDAAKEQPLWSQADRADNHNGGCVQFGPDGYLYVSTGDGGAGDDQLNNARFINKGFYSAILRMDVEKRKGNLPPNPAPGIPVDTSGEAFYSVPSDNPFVNATSYHGEAVDPKTVRTEIWASGFRNPWRFSIDMPTNRVFVADVGQGRWEEVDIAVKGGDYGWSYREGFHPFTAGPGGSKLPAKFEPLDPIFEYPRNVGISITGGVVYRGTELADLKENYIFADFGTGSVIALQEKAGKWEPQMLAKESGIAGIGINPRNGDVLFANLNGTIKKLKVQ